MPATVSHTTRTFPFGEEMAAQHAGGDYATRYKFNGKELDQETGYYYYGARYYDPVISRWLSVDPLAEKYPRFSAYNYTLNNPIRYVDSDGKENDDWVEINGKMIYDNRVTNQDDATALYGENAIYRPIGYTYTTTSGERVELGDYGFYKKNGQIFSAPDMAQYSLAYTNPELAMAKANATIEKLKLSYSFVLGIRTFQAADAATPEPTDVVPLKWLAYGLLFLGTAYYIAKMEKEIEAIRRRAGGPQGVQYSLRATSSGQYVCYTCISGTIDLSSGDVWKYGETINPGNRYSDKWLIDNSLRFVPEFYGNQVQIKIEEKKKIYGYFLKYGHLPPGNKIFR